MQRSAAVKDTRRFVFGLISVLGTVAALTAAGTELSIALGEPTVICPDGNVSVSYTIATTAASAATVNETLTDSSNNTVAQRSYDILSGNVPGGWVFAGRTKTYDGLFQTTGLSDGNYSLQICVTQAGSGGNPNKTVCTTQPIVIRCVDQIANPCASTAPFGEVVANNKISKDAAAQIQFRGNFGPTAAIEITDANGFYRSASVSKAGDSCNYHANWKFTTSSGADIFGNNGAGVYTVTVTGNNQPPLQFSVSLAD
jgi:hypothetical protein